jgi:hypothetical protein
MKWCFGLCVAAHLAGLLAAPCRAGGVEDYLTKDGQLKAAVTFRIDTVGLAPAGTPKGEAWVIEPTGEWTSQVAKGKGKLSAKQLAALAHHLAAQDFNSLPRAQGYKEQAIDEVYQRVVIGFGKKSATFNVKMGESPLDYLPKPDDPRAAAWSRFVALQLVLADLLRQPVLTPGQVVEQKLEGPLCVEFRVAAAGRTTSPVKPGERPALLLQPDQSKTKPDQFLAFLVGPTTAELQAKFGGDLQKLFLGRTVRVTGKVTRAPIAGGSAFQMAVTSSKDIEIVEAP